MILVTGYLLWQLSHASDIASPLSGGGTQSSSAVVYHYDIDQHESTDQTPYLLNVDSMSAFHAESANHVSGRSRISLPIVSYQLMPESHRLAMWERLIVRCL